MFATTVSVEVLSEIESVAQRIDTLKKRLEAAEAHRPTVSQIIGARKRSDPPPLEEWKKRWPEEHKAHGELMAELEPLEKRKDELNRIRWATQEAAERERQVVEYLREVAPRIAGRLETATKRTPAIEAVEKFEDSAAWCLLLLGGIGTGKSTAAGVSAARFAVRTEPTGDGFLGASFSLRWVRASESSRLSGFGEETEQRLQSWRACFLFVLDDIGTEMLTPVWQQILDDILDDRYQHSRRTIITSNLSPEQFKARYGERLADRIREGGMVTQLEGDSMRKTT